MEFELKNYASLVAISDWIELTVAVQGEVSKSHIDHILVNNSYSAEDSESYINSIWGELRERNRRYNGISPMNIDSFTVETNITWTDFPEYILMLVLSLEGNGWKPQQTGALFERICKEALEEYIGGNAKVVGFPEKVSVQNICKEINEEFIQELPARYQDRKLDVVGWKHIDNRNNKLLILMQCAAGNDWRSKTTELQVDVWRNYIRFGCIPTRAFGFSQCIDDQLFFDIGQEGGIIFDRLRLYRYLSAKNPIKDSELRPAVLDWCNNRLPTLATT